MLARQARAMLVVKLLATAVSYGFALALARRLDAAQFGQVAVVLNAAFVLAVIGARGQHMALLRFIPSLPDKPAVIPPSGMPDSRWGFPSGPISDSMW